MKNSNWSIYNKKADIDDISNKFKISKLTAKILCNRDIKTYEEIEKILSSNLDDLNDETLLPDIEKAASAIIDDIKNKKHIRIVGDYDIDGITSTYILLDGLKYLGANVSFVIPNRVKDGYGINISIIEQAIIDKVDTIITCDNGIAASDEIDYAVKNNIRVIVTDHHDIANIPKSAYAVVDPKREDVEKKYPFKEICGCTVAWKFIIYLYKKLNIDIDVRYKYLEFVAIATIGDIMPLINENHIITKLGLKKILGTENKGLKKILEVTNLTDKKISSYHVGFIIGPLINASGRLRDAKIALKLFMSDNENETDNLANELKKLNDERKKITEDGVNFAIDLVEKNYRDDKVILIYINQQIEQVAGIIAGRIKEKYNKPTIVLTDTLEENVVKASCRSIEAYDMFSSLNKHNELFIKFGGHKMAAGFSILKKDIEKLRDLLNKESDLTTKDFIKKYYIDAEIPVTLVNEELIKDIEKIEPYGNGNEKPIFATRDVKFLISNVYGENNNVIKFEIEKESKKGKAVLFENIDIFKDNMKDKNSFDILFYPTINEYKGYKNVDINIIDYR